MTALQSICRTGAIRWYSQFRAEKPFAKIPVLNRPIGSKLAPHVLDNQGIDNRTWSETFRDMKDYDKHLQRREKM